MSTRRRIVRYVVVSGSREHPQVERKCYRLRRFAEQEAAHLTVAFDGYPHRVVKLVEAPGQARRRLQTIREPRCGRCYRPKCRATDGAHTTPAYYLVRCCAAHGARVECAEFAAARRIVAQATKTGRHRAARRSVR